MVKKEKNLKLKLLVIGTIIALVAIVIKLIQTWDININF